MAVGANHGLSYYKLMTTYQECNTLPTYRSKDEVRRHTTSMEFTNRADRDGPDLEFLAEIQGYLRTSDRQLQRELGDHARWGDADTYDHTRKLNKGKYNDKGTGGDSRRTFRDSRSNRRFVNCAEWEGEDDKGNDFSGDWDNSDYHGGHPLNQVNQTEKENNYPPSERPVGDIEDWQSDSEVGNYGVNRIVSGGYRDAGRTEVWGDFATFSKTNLARQRRAEKGTIGKEI